MSLTEVQTREDELVWYFAYASSMMTAALCKQMGGPPPVKSVPVGLNDAWLAFDYLGLPYVEPAYASLIIKGINDGSFAQDKSCKVESLEYKRYLRQRCYPGISSSDEMDVPPCAEGIAHRVTQTQLERLGSPSGFKLVPVQCQRLSERDASERVGESFMAMALVAKDKYRSLNLMPSLKVFYAIYRGALVSHLSGSYLGHITLLRPYNTEHGGKRAQIGQKLFKLLVLLPQFMALYMPLVVLQRISGRLLFSKLEYLKQEVGDWIRWTSILTESWVFRPIFGDVAYAIEQD